MYFLFSVWMWVFLSTAHVQLWDVFFWSLCEFPYEIPRSQIMSQTLYLSVHHVSTSPFTCVVLQDQFIRKSNHICWHVHQHQAQDTCSLFTDYNLSSHEHQVTKLQDCIKERDRKNKIRKDRGRKDRKRRKERTGRKNERKEKDKELKGRKEKVRKERIKNQQEGRKN